ncbi:hypothetical protein ACN6LM_002473 [Streptomyces sp. SAS_281]|uniref:hypothetical protein n=1 Tax=Streptomyces sp. SAS_281 TaxID=3412744 RepID=UPI00403CCA56
MEDQRPQIAAFPFWAPAATPSIVRPFQPTVLSASSVASEKARSGTDPRRRRNTTGCRAAAADHEVTMHFSPSNSFGSPPRIFWY